MRESPRPELSLQTWLLHVAGAIEGWPGLPAYAYEGATDLRPGPRGALEFIVYQLPSTVQSDVMRALPPIATDDYAEAGRIIRAAALELP